jgi:hypothetical protein
MVFSYLILLAAIAMTTWGFFGFLEYYTGLAVIPLQNPTFPKGTQFVHWLLIFSSGTIYLAGYFTRWKGTPFAMVVLYAMLATLCAVETFDFMKNPGRHGDFIRECIMYVGISIYLFRSQRMRSHFGH